MNKSSTAAIWASFVCIGAIFFYFAFLAPFMTDNFVFSRDIIPGYAQFYKGAKISSSEMTLHGAFRQAVEMYFTWCGRFMGNMAVYLLFMLPRALYCGLAAASFSFYVFLLHLCVFGHAWRQNLTIGWIFGIAALLWMGLPSFGEAFFWLCVGGQVALLAQAGVLLPFRFALDSVSEYEQNKSFWTRLPGCVLFFCGGVIACSLDYPSCAALPPTAFICCAVLFFCRREVFHRCGAFLLSGSFGLAIGSAITLLAPGNAARMRLTDDATVHAWQAAGWGERLLTWLLHLPGGAVMMYVPLIFLAFGCWTLWRRYGRIWVWQIPPAALLFLLPALFTVGAYLFTAWPPARAFNTCSVQLIVCACIVYLAARKVSPKLKWFRLLASVFGCISILSLGGESIRFFLLNESIMEREKIIASAGKGVAILPPISVRATSHQVLGGSLNDISQEQDFWVNRAMASYYGLAGIIREPMETYECKFEPASGLKPIYADRLENMTVRIVGNRLNISFPNPEKPHPEGEIHFYYHGRPGIMGYWPYELDKPGYNWLSAANDWRAKLLPILLARTDINVEDKVSSSISRPLKLGARDKIWMVAPGESKYSFNLLPMRCGPVGKFDNN